MNDKFFELLDEKIPNPKCTLNYNKDYELLIATMLSAQCTDERVNKVTEVLFNDNDIYSLSKAKKEDIIDIIRPCGNMNKKSEYIIEIAKRLVTDFEGTVPNNREYLESLPGIGRKTANVVLANIFGVPTFAVDTHVERVSKRFGFAKNTDDVVKIEEKLMKLFPEEKCIKLHHQFLLFGRHICTSRNPHCDNCNMKEYCKEKMLK
ncbi:MAG: endonuclease III [Erysipelotrichales bacterium]|nr:endonuclease III [Erysipelotrichales bacterium]